MNWENAIKQSEIETIHNLGPNSFKRWRDRNLVRGDDWDKNGRVIYLTVQAYEKYKSSLGSPNPNESDNDSDEKQEGMLRLRIVKPAKNPCFVYGDLEGKCVPVRCKRSESPKLMRKTVNVSVSEDSGEPVYTYVR